MIKKDVDAVSIVLESRCAIETDSVTTSNNQASVELEGTGQSSRYSQQPLKPLGPMCVRRRDDRGPSAPRFMSLEDCRCLFSCESTICQLETILWPRINVRMSAVVAEMESTIRRLESTREEEREVVAKLDALETEVEKLLSISKKQTLLALPSQGVREAVDNLRVLSSALLLMTETHSTILKLQSMQHRFRALQTSAAFDGSAAAMYAKALRTKLELDVAERQVEASEASLRKMAESMSGDVRALIGPMSV